MKAMLDAGVETTLFGTLRSFPLATVTVSLAVFLIAIFFITGADSASIVMGMLSQRGHEEPNRLMVIFWGVSTGAIAAVLLFANGLSALQTGVIIVGFPFLIILIGLCVSLWKSLREEPFESTLRPRLRSTLRSQGREIDELEEDIEELGAIVRNRTQPTES
jgi:glycine betaine transporter